MAQTFTEVLKASAGTLAVIWFCFLYVFYKVYFDVLYKRTFQNEDEKKLDKFDVSPTGRMIHDGEKYREEYRLVKREDLHERGKTK